MVRPPTQAHANCAWPRAASSARTRTRTRTDTPADVPPPAPRLSTGRAMYRKLERRPSNSSFDLPRPSEPHPDETLENKPVLEDDDCAFVMDDAPQPAHAHAPMTAPTVRERLLCMEAAVPVSAPGHGPMPEPSRVDPYATRTGAAARGLAQPLPPPRDSIRDSHCPNDRQQRRSA